jgi:predicted ATPase/DNA-binding CsgD family transcriptional regulator
MKVTQKSKSPPNNLPTPLSTFIGREREISEVKQLLSTHRLVTLTGAGGSGKTRLALRVVEELLGEFEHGIWLVELASIFDDTIVLQTIGSIFDIREQSGQTLLDILINHLSTRQSLLVLDNCEHLISTCAQLVELLLQKCPRLKILTTSRELLSITGEVAWSVPPLSLPGEQPWTNPHSTEAAIRLYEESESVQLFVARAMANAPDFRLTAEKGGWVAEICRHLDGMPLAIELAAARVRTLSVQQIAQRLDDRFHLLTGGSRTAPPRQQTLRSTLDWSYTLLSKLEAKVLQRLSVFVGGVSLAAAEAVCAGDGVASAEILDALSHLADKSLLTAAQPRQGESRYHLLETIRQYAFEKLKDSGSVEECRDRHLDYFIQWAQAVESHLRGADQLASLSLFEIEHDNLRAALEWSFAAEDRAEQALRLVVACGRFWRWRGLLSEGRGYMAHALSMMKAHEKTEMRALALCWAASLAYLQSDYPATRVLVEESLAIWRELKPGYNVGLADALDLLGELATEEGDYASAPVFFQEALEIFRALEDQRGIGDILLQLGWAYMRMGRYEAVAPYIEEALGLFRELGHASLLAFSLAGLGELSIRQGQYERATELIEESLAIRVQHRYKWGIAASLGSLGWIALRQHNFERMRAMLRESLSLRMEISDMGGIAWCLEKLAEAKYEQSLPEDATKIFGYAQTLRAPIGSVIDPADQSDYNRILSDLQSTLGTDAFAALWSNSAAMRLEDVIELAVSQIETAHTEKEKFGGLTRREREVAALIAQGKSNREIANEMTVGLKTVETYVTRILNKLGFGSRVHIATWAVEKGLK